MPNNPSIEHIEIDASNFNACFDLNALPALPTRNLVLFPDMVFPINLVRDSSKEIARIAYENNLALGVFCQMNPDLARPGFADLFPFGVLAQVIKILPLPDETEIALVRTREKLSLSGPAQSPIDRAIGVKADIVRELSPKQDSYFKEIMKFAREKMRNLADKNGMNMQVFDAQAEQHGSLNPVMEVSTMATNAPIATERRRELLAAKGVRKRLERLCEYLVEQEQSRSILSSIEERAKLRMAERGRSQYLEAQMQEIRN